MPIESLTSNVVKTRITPNLPAAEYQLQLTNGDKQTTVAPKKLAIFDPVRACFYDFFESGLAKWAAQSGRWSIVPLLDSGHGLADSPMRTYTSARPPKNKEITSMTSIPIDLRACANPILTFQHDYVLARYGTSQDLARVEISINDGLSWRTLGCFSGGGLFSSKFEGTTCESLQAITAAASSSWPTLGVEEIDLSDYADQEAVRLRFSLEVDDTIAAKGWILDDVMVVDGARLSHTYRRSMREPLSP